MDSFCLDDTTLEQNRAEGNGKLQLLAIGITFMETLNALATLLLSKYVSPLDVTHRPAFTTQRGNKEMMFPSFVCPLRRLVLSEVANQCRLKSLVSNIR